MVDDGFLCKKSNNLVIGANPCIFFLDRVRLPQVFCLSGLATSNNPVKGKKQLIIAARIEKKLFWPKLVSQSRKKLGLLERSGLEAQNIRSISLLGRCYHFLFLAWPSPSNLGAGRPGWEEDGKEGRAGD